MDSNPYAAPSSNLEGPSAPLEADVGPEEWSVWNALRRTWAVYRRDWLLLTLPFLLQMVAILLEESRWRGATAIAPAPRACSAFPCARCATRSASTNPMGSTFPRTASPRDG